MRIVIAPDSFKESLTAREVARAIYEGVRRAAPGADIDEVPMADGGEGTVDALVAATGGHLITLEVTGPLGEPVRATYGVLGDGSTAVIEMASASGISLVPKMRRDPRLTTTRGTGELVLHALEQGMRRIIIGIGGSATNDAGAGMAQALGYRLLDAGGQELGPGGAELARLDRIDAKDRHPGLDECQVQAACDVTNPLCGPSGASRTYGPQKGADDKSAEELDAALAQFAEIAERTFGISVRDVPGAGAAGGLGAGLLVFASAELLPGFDIVADAAGLDRRMIGADLVFTGEGMLDIKTMHGKTPAGVAHRARRLGVPVVALVGWLGDGWRELYKHGVVAAFALADGPMSLDSAMHRTGTLLADRAEAVLRLWSAAKPKK